MEATKARMRFLVFENISTTNKIFELPISSSLSYRELLTTVIIHQLISTDLGLH